MGKFKTGDIVILKSGGPKMTVENSPENPKSEIKCQLFAGAKLELGFFLSDSIRIVEEEKNKESKG